MVSTQSMFLSELLVIYFPPYDEQFPNLKKGMKKLC